MPGPDLIVAAAAGAVVITNVAFHWSAATSIRRAVNTYTAHLTALARARAAATRPAPPLPPDPPNWARDTTIPMRPVPAPTGGLSRTGPRPPRPEV